METRICSKLTIKNLLYKTIVLLLLFVDKPLAEVYKYQDENGKWQFTDKKPLNKEVETLAYKTDEKKKIGPAFSLGKHNRLNVLVVENPFFAPVEIRVVSEQIHGGSKTFVLGPRKKLNVIESINKIGRYQYRWHLGDPNAVPGKQQYNFPVNERACARISQGFNGSFSHYKNSSRYAVDIALSVGTPILAARDGVVVQVKDDYYMGGVNEYFLDKANFVQILHDDGTFGRYAHILLGTAVVKPGDKIKTGTMLAKSGSSGYSSGPHLHFVVTRNKGFESISIPFQFIGKNGAAFAPEKNMKLCD